MTPLPLLVPKYFEYPRSTVLLIDGVGAGAADEQAASVRNIKVLNIFQSCKQFLCLGWNEIWEWSEEGNIFGKGFDVYMHVAETF